jgi:hypothetical protein
MPRAKKPGPSKGTALLQKALPFNEHLHGSHTRPAVGDSR